MQTLLVQDQEALLPRDTYTLIDQLNEAYPPRCIGATESMIDAQRYAAKRELVDELIALRTEEQEAAHEADSNNP